MLSYLRYRYKLHKLEKKRQRVINEEGAGLGDPREFKPEDYTSMLYSGHAASCEHVEREMDELLMGHLLPIARRLRVEIPWDTLGDDDPFWHTADGVSGRILRPVALKSLLEGIKKEKREIRLEWCQWLAAFTGIIGAATGLAAILMQ